MDSEVRIMSLEKKAKNTPFYYFSLYSTTTFLATNGAIALVNLPKVSLEGCLSENGRSHAVEMDQLIK